MATGWFVPQAVICSTYIHKGKQIFTSRLEKLFTESSEITEIMFAETRSYRSICSWVTN